MLPTPRPLATTTIPLSPTSTLSTPTNPYVNLTSLSLTDYYSIKNNATCLSPNRHDCLLSLWDKISPRPNNTFNLSPNGNHTSYTNSSSSHQETYSSEEISLWSLVICLGGLAVAFVTAIVVACVKCFCLARKRKQEAKAAEGASNRTTDAAAHVYEEPRRGSVWKALGGRKPSSNEGDGSGRGRGASNSSTAVPVRFDFPGPSVRRTRDNGSAEEMPPPVYEMADLDVRHEVHLSGAPRYEWEDPWGLNGENRETEAREFV